jgi:hypothetical protein
MDGDIYYTTQAMVVDDLLTDIQVTIRDEGRASDINPVESIK